MSRIFYENVFKMKAFSVFWKRFLVNAHFKRFVNTLKNPHVSVLFQLLARSGIITPETSWKRFFGGFAIFVESKRLHFHFCWNLSNHVEDDFWKRFHDWCKWKRLHCEAFHNLSLFTISQIKRLFCCVLRVSFCVLIVIVFTMTHTAMWYIRACVCACACPYIDKIKKFVKKLI